MAEYDDVLEGQMAELRLISSERIELGRSDIDDDAAAAEYFAVLDALEYRFERVTNMLRALFFDSPDETPEEYQKRLSAWVDYRAKIRFAPAPTEGSFRIGDIASTGPVERFHDLEHRRRAAQAREARIKRIRGE